MHKPRLTDLPNRRGWLAAGLLTAVLGGGLAAGVPIAAADTGAGPAAPTATFSRTSDWGTGFVGQYVIRNGSTSPVNGWKLDLDLPQGMTLTDAWSGNLSSSGDHYELTNADWNATIAPGDSVTVGFQGAEQSSSQEPTGCALNGLACDGSGEAGSSGGGSGGSGGDPAPPSGGGSGDTGSDPSPPPAAGATADITAPYVDMTLWPQFSLAQAAKQSNVNDYTLAFIVSGRDAAPCTPEWGGLVALDDPFITSSLSDLRAAGGNAIISFGGAANQELALTCDSADSLQAAYQSVIDSYGVRDLDFDVEGTALGDDASIQRRVQALAQLQAAGRADGKPVTVSFTLPVMPTGLTQGGLNVIKAAQTAGVDVSVVNLMAMDYYDPSLSYDGKMGDYAIQAATSVQSQLAQLYPDRSDAELWKMVGVTPMIGINDDPQEVFTTADATKLANFAAQKGLGRLSMWSANRDAQCPSPSSTTENTCSGVTQAPWAFADALASGSAS